MCSLETLYIIFKTIGQIQALSRKLFATFDVEILFSVATQHFALLELESKVLYQQL